MTKPHRRPRIMQLAEVRAQYSDAVQVLQNLRCLLCHQSPRSVRCDHIASLAVEGMVGGTVSLVAAGKHNGQIVE